MRRNLHVLLAGSMLMLLLVPVVVAQNETPLGDAARLARRHKPAPAPGERVYDNDNLPGKGVVNTVGAAPSDQPAADQSTSTETASTDAAKGPTDAAKTDADKEKAAATAADQQKKLNSEWAAKISQQKDEISRLERELNVLQREGQIQAAVNAADLGTRIGNNAKYAEQQKQNQEQIEAKQKALDDAKQKLADLQEAARKAGASASSRE